MRSGALSCLLAGMVSGVCAQEELIKTDDIRVRDPFIYADTQSRTYFLYAQRENRKGGDYKGVEVYTSKDLARWSQPKPVLKLPADMGVSMVWAPEMHHYRGAYYLFVTLTFNSTLPLEQPVKGDKWPPMHRRGTWIYRATAPDGVFEPLASDSITPPQSMALDGTLFVEEDGTPFMIYCHEWVELIDGAMCAIRLKEDLSGALGAPIKLFNASSAPGAKSGATEGKVTDGAFLYRSPQSQVLYMIWSTFLHGKGYSVLLTRSESGKAIGPWGAHTPIFTADGGHGMIFKTFEHKLMLALHQPNKGPMERLHIHELIDDGVSLRVKGSIVE